MGKLELDTLVHRLKRFLPKWSRAELAFYCANKAAEASDYESYLESRYRGESLRMVRASSNGLAGVYGKLTEIFDA